MENRGKDRTVTSIWILKGETVGIGSTNIPKLCPAAQFGTSGITFRVLIPDGQPVSYFKLDI